MLVLSRKIGERILVPHCAMTVTVIAVEGNRVRLARNQVEHVAGPGRDQHPARAAQRAVGLDDPAQAGHVGVDAALGAGRGILSPDGIDELAPGYHAVRPHR